MYIYTHIYIYIYIFLSLILLLYFKYYLFLYIFLISIILVVFHFLVRSDIHCECTKSIHTLHALYRYPVLAVNIRMLFLIYGAIFPITANVRANFFCTKMACLFFFPILICRTPVVLDVYECHPLIFELLLIRRTLAIGNFAFLCHRVHVYPFGYLSRNIRGIITVGLSLDTDLVIFLVQNLGYVLCDILSLKSICLLSSSKNLLFLFFFLEYFS